MVVETRSAPVALAAVLCFVLHVALAPLAESVELIFRELLVRQFAVFLQSNQWVTRVNDSNHEGKQKDSRTQTAQEYHDIAMNLE